ncbi:hypothetical protein WR164_02750 [Philodulcilactobacillus myokoensis]|uniref:Aminoglycoside phosphotransferase domain-containing protein n=2 Tax=Philodulcilactobacillus myokoensis TaxID=2929573 RepID=A0A9W6EQZ9_9LACO|nr:hypothetical protein WR164_02750 [Philodulcilactobacillus myokoensis]
MKLLPMINQRLNADMKPIHHASLNEMMVGYSQQFHQRVFVKIFNEDHKSKFMTETKVNQQLNDRVLQTFVVQSKPKWNVLVMKDIAPQNIHSAITPRLANQMGQVLARFHQNVRPFHPMVVVNHLFAKTSFDINHLQNGYVQQRLLRMLKVFKSNQKKLQNDFKLQSKVVLHGDVGIRNYQIVDHHLVLIDYERARLGVPYQDVIKLFYENFHLNHQLIQAFLKGYNSIHYFDKGTKLTRNFLVFMTAVGIIKYVEKIRDDSFRKIGEQMLNHVQLFYNLILIKNTREGHIDEVQKNLVCKCCSINCRF